MRRGFRVGGFPPSLPSLTLLSFSPALLPFTAPTVSKPPFTTKKRRGQEDVHPSPKLWAPLPWLPDRWLGPLTSDPCPHPTPTDPPGHQGLLRIHKCHKVTLSLNTYRVPSAKEEVDELGPASWHRPMSLAVTSSPQAPSPPIRQALPWDPESPTVTLSTLVLPRASLI